MATIKIQPGETLSGIASQFGTTIKNIQSLNPSIKDPNMIQAGSTLNIPEPKITPVEGVSVEKLGNLPPVIPPKNEGSDFLSILNAGVNFGNTPEYTQGAETRKQLLGDITKLQTEIPGKAQFESEKRTALGIPEQEQRLNEVNTELAQIKAETQAKILGSQGGKTSKGYQSAEAAAYEREGAIKSLSLSAEASALEGKLNLANSNLKRAVDLEFDTKETSLKNKLDQLQLLEKYVLSPEEEQMKEMRKQIYERELKELETQKTDKKNFVKSAVDAISRGARISLSDMQTLYDSDPTKAMQVVANAENMAEISKEDRAFGRSVALKQTPSATEKEAKSDFEKIVGDKKYLVFQNRLKTLSSDDNVAKAKEYGFEGNLEELGRLVAESSMYQSKSEIIDDLKRLQFDGKQITNVNKLYNLLDKRLNFEDYQQ